MTNLTTLTESNFKKTIEENEFVIVDFWATWCKPCVAFTPIFEAAAKKNKDIIFYLCHVVFASPFDHFIKCWGAKLTILRMNSSSIPNK